MSGNTEEIAEHISNELLNEGIQNKLVDIWSGKYPSSIGFDSVFIGTYTWDYGLIPEEVEVFTEYFEYSDQSVYVFGSGDTQFGGDEVYCKAVKDLAERFSSPAPPLKIEQSPRGSQEKNIREWVDNIVNKQGGK